MANFNKVILAGNLTRDPELRYTPKGVAIAKFGMAINRTWKNEAGESKEEVTFVDVDAFGRTAEVISQYLKKGRPILVEVDPVRPCLHAPVLRVRPRPARAHLAERLRDRRLDADAQPALGPLPLQGLLTRPGRHQPARSASDGCPLLALRAGARLPTGSA